MRGRSSTLLTKMFFGACLAVLLVQSPVFAQENQTAVFYPTDDAYVDLAATALNFGSAPLLEFSWSAVQTAAGVGNKLQIDRLSYLKFDLSLSKDSIIRSAFLRLYVTDAVTDTSTLIVLPEKNTAWKETTITGKNAPDVPGSEKELRDRAIYEVKITNLKTWYALNVTSYARSVRSGLLSFMVIGGNTESPWEDIVQFYSKESADPALRPYLEVTYSGNQVGIVYLTLRSNVAGGSVYFNGTEYKIPNIQEVVLDVPTGRYKIEASPTISISDRARAVFQKWNDGSADNPREVQVSKSITLEARYLEQYYLNVATRYGVANGAGWYRSGSTATVGVSGDLGANPPRVQADGILGLLGVTYVFDHWSGYPGDSSKLRIVVNDPVTVTAIWRQDYSLLYSNLIRATLSLGAGFVAAVLLRRRMLSTQQPTGIRSERQRTGPVVRAKPALAPASRTVVAPVAPTKPAPYIRTPEPARAVVIRQREPLAAPTTTVTSAAATKFCRECGAKIPRGSRYCEECGKKLT